VALRREPVSGFKAALTAAAAQQAMDVDAPIVGVLFADGDLTAEQTIHLQKQALLETEIGFVCARDITAPVNVDTVLANMSGCMPMIELASPNLANKPNGLDLVATNAASYCYLQGPLQPADTPLDALTVRLEMGDETLLSGRGGEVLGGQLDALTWLVNQVLERDYAIKAGHILMTGSIGGMTPARPGDYTADFETLGSLTFRLAA